MFYSSSSFIFHCLFLFRLFGSLPFEDDSVLGSTSKEDPSQKTKVMKLDLTSSVWDSVSPEAKDLVSRMIQINPAERLSLVQVLNHPWFVGKENKQIEHEVTFDDNDNCGGSPVYFVDESCSNNNTAVDGLITKKEDDKSSLPSSSSSNPIHFPSLGEMKSIEKEGDVSQEKGELNFESVPKKKAKVEMGTESEKKGKNGKKKDSDKKKSKKTSDCESKKQSDISSFFKPNTDQ